MKIDILTLFPEMFTGPFDQSMVKRGRDKGLVEINIHNLRKWAKDNYGSVDDHPYGGGPGMVMRVDIIDEAVTAIKSQIQNSKPQINSKVILLDARGEQFSQKKAKELSENENLIFVCGHYEGVDWRVAEHVADEVVSVGPYVLSGGEVAAMVIVDSVVRLIPGVLGNEESLAEESHDESGLEYPQYTRPENYNGWKVPDVLLSGNHKQIQEWRRKIGDDLWKLNREQK